MDTNHIRKRYLMLYHFFSLSSVKIKESLYPGYKMAFAGLFIVLKGHKGFILLLASISRKGPVWRSGPRPKKAVICMIPSISVGPVK